MDRCQKLFIVRIFSRKYVLVLTCASAYVCAFSKVSHLKCIGSYTPTVDLHPAAMLLHRSEQISPHVLASSSPRVALNFALHSERFLDACAVGRSSYTADTYTLASTLSHGRSAHALVAASSRRRQAAASCRRRRRRQLACGLKFSWRQAGEAGGYVPRRVLWWCVECLIANC